VSADFCGANTSTMVWWYWMQTWEERSAVALGAGCAEDSNPSTSRPVTDTWKSLLLLSRWVLFNAHLLACWCNRSSHK
jgi:hypothetical protein